MACVDSGEATSTWTKHAAPPVPAGVDAARDLAAYLTWSCLVGPRGKGWVVSRSTLKYERALIGDTDINRRTLDGMVMMAQAIDRRGKPVIEDGALRGRLVEASHQLARERYSWDVVVGRLAEVYAERYGH
jgi:glycosyltransferase involved in cell wall biosynthesis